MPDLVSASRLFRHDVHSAVASLAALGIPLDRITLRYEAGGEPGRVLAQLPAPGTPLDGARSIELRVAGTGTLYSLPYVLRDATEPGQMAVDTLAGVLDTALIRARLYVRQAGGHFLLQPGVPITALRWIQDVMRLDASPWSRDEWYRVARFLSALPNIAGRLDAVAVALRFVFGLPVAESSLRYARLPMRESLGTRLGERNGRLGVDAVVGNGLMAPHRLLVRVGPVPFTTYVQQHPRASARQALYRLLLPAFLPGGVEERWVVEPRSEGYRLNSREAPAMLGASAYLAGVPPRSAAPELVRG
jgi:hypothetical protein